MGIFRDFREIEIDSEREEAEDLYAEFVSDDMDLYQKGILRDAIIEYYDSQE